MKHEFDGNDVVPLVSGADLRRFHQELAEAQARHFPGMQPRAGLQPFFYDISMRAPDLSGPCDANVLAKRHPL